MNNEWPIVAVGEMAIGTRIFDPAGRPLTQELAEVMSVLSAADTVFGHLELPPTNHGHPQEKWVALSSPPELADQYRLLRISAMSGASNHMMDFGYEGLDQTMETLQDQGIAFFGAGSNLEEANAPWCFTVRGRRVALLNVASLLPLSSAAGPGRPGISPLRVITRYEVDPNLLLEQPGTPPIVRTEPVPADLEAVVARIQAARKEADFVIVCPHWGVGGELRRAEYQEILGHSFIDAGADLVIGTHPHVIQAIERYHDRYIFCNLGEFIYTLDRDRLELPPHMIEFLKNMQSQGLLVGIDFAADGELRLAVRPTRVARDGHCFFLKGPELDEIVAHVRGESDELGTRINLTDDWLVLS